MRTIEVDKLLQPTIEALDKTTESKDSHRQSITVIWWDAENGALVSTNGRSMLVCKYPELKKKFGETSGAFRYTKPYLIEDEKYLENHVFPTWQRVVPKYDSTMRMDAYINKGMDTKYKPFFLMAYITKCTGKMFNPKFYDNVGKIICNFTDFYNSNKFNPVVLTNSNDTLQYVIMPIVAD